MNTQIGSGISNISEIATPNSAECAMVSPKYAMRCHTIKHPRGPVDNTTPAPARKARVKNSLYILLLYILLIATSMR